MVLKAASDKGLRPAANSQKWGFLTARRRGEQGWKQAKNSTWRQMCRKPKHSAGLSGVFNYSLTFAVERVNQETSDRVKQEAERTGTGQAMRGQISHDIP